MRKIATLFKRDPDDMRHVLAEVNPGCEWVLAGEGVPTRKYDGTCVLIRRDETDAHAFARREVKAGKPTPPGFEAIETDDTTGKTVGWEPADQSGFAKYIAEAIGNHTEVLAEGTYELCGPKVQGNPEGFDAHVLVSHADAQVIEWVPNSYEGFAEFMPGFAFEGIVWHHPDGRMVKLKKRDFAT